jgi:hypothetical protein
MTSLVVTPANKHEFIFLKEMFERMKIEFKPLSYNISSENEEEDWYKFSMLNFSKAYSEDEPEYTSDMIKEPNPIYNPKFNKTYLYTFINQNVAF